jgi:hypothetical protein
MATAADPDDAGVRDIGGFDTATPQRIANFATGGHVARRWTAG